MDKKTVLLVACKCGKVKHLGDWNQPFSSFKDFLDKMREGRRIPRACFLGEDTIEVKIQFKECDSCRKKHPVLIRG